MVGWRDPCEDPCEDVRVNNGEHVTAGYSQGMPGHHPD